MSVAARPLVRPLLAVTLLGLLLRTLFAVLVPVVPAMSDPTAYVRFAESLSRGHGFGWGPAALTAFWPPGPSAMYAALFYLFGERLWLIAAAHVVIGTATVTLTMLLAAHFHGVRVATLAGLLLAVWPQMIFFTTIPSSEPLFTLLVLMGLATWLGVRSLAFKGIAVGGLFALASLARPTGLLLAGVLAAADVFRERRLLRPAAAAALAGVVTLGLLLPWAYRNQQVLGRAFLTSSSGSANAWLGNNTRQLPPGEMWPPEVSGMSEVERADYLAAEVRAFIRERPLEYLRRCVVRFFRVHERESIGVVWNDRSFESVGIGPRGQTALKLLANLYYWPVLLAALVGLWLYVRREGLLSLPGHPLAMLWLYFAAVHALTVVQDRYHVPSVPAMAVFAALTLDVLLQRRGAAGVATADPAPRDTAGATGTSPPAAP